MSASSQTNPAASALTTLKSLLDNFTSVLSSSSPSSQPESKTLADPGHSPLVILKTSTTLLKSQTTTLSLLLITPPYTPSAVAKSIRICVDAIVGMMAAWEMFAARQLELGKMIVEEVCGEVKDVVEGMTGVVAGVEAKSVASTGVKGAGTLVGKEQEEQLKQQVLAATGLLWSRCDRLIETCTAPLPGVLVRRVTAWRETLMDALDELKEWSEQEPRDDEKDSGFHSGDEDEDEDGDDPFAPSDPIPLDRPEMKALLTSSLKALRLINTLYQALVKRRISTFPVPDVSKLPTADSSKVSRASAKKIDELVGQLESIPGSADDLAAALYDLDEDVTRQRLRHLCSQARKTADPVKPAWPVEQGEVKEDVFAAWLEKWTAALQTVEQEFAQEQEGKKVTGTEAAPS